MDRRILRSPEAPRFSVSPGFCALVCLMLFLGGPGIALPFFLSAGLHEGGHLLALGLLGIPVRSLELRASGAVIRAELPGDLRELPAAAAGPAVNLLLCGCFCRIWPSLWLCSLVQLLWNLLPVYPLDGGRICRLLLPRLFGARGIILCQLLERFTALTAVLAGIWGTFALGLGLLPLLLAGFFLLRLPNSLDKASEC